ncbi:MAG: radical SAM protein, partial [Gemmataceae bacterium]
MDSIYWVISRDCNQKCPHCYNNSAPGAPGLTIDQIDSCVGHLPDPEEVPVDRIILSGGEVLVWPELLFHALDRLQARYGTRSTLMVQTNGDLLDESMLDRLLGSGVRRIDVASMDRYHPKSTLERRAFLEGLFAARDMVEASTIAHGDSQARPLT